MNPTLCPLCNHLLAKRRDAFMKSEWHEFQRIQNELDVHQASCVIIRSELYLCLWPTARLHIPVSVETEAG